VERKVISAEKAVDIKMKTMDAFEIIGGKSLSGSIVPQGAKNEALQVICATLLTADTVKLSNIPDIRDVNLLIELLGDIGSEIHNPEKGVFTFRANNINLAYLQTEDYKLKASKLRGSVMLLGPMLARFKKAYIPKPGGDKIGRRRIDTHLIGFENLGAKFIFNTSENTYTLDASNMKGCYMLLDEASVTGTANIVMAASMTPGTTTIYNAACEPYLQQLCRMLVSMGAKIKGIGSNLLVIEGVDKLIGTEHRLLADMIEVGSFIGLAAMTHSDITIENAQVEHLGRIPDVFRKLGIKMDIDNDNIHVPAQDHYEIQTFIDGSILTIADAPWPGFTPDLLSVALVVATQAHGSVLIHQKMFESRLFFVDRLIEMGAQIILCDPHRAAVVGLDHSSKLRGIEMSSPDIRAGVSLLIAALSADGKSIIRNINQIDRGYQQIDKRLQKLGAQIQRI